MQSNKEIEREDNLIIIQLCLRKQIATAEEYVTRGLIHTYSRLPHALVDKDGLYQSKEKSVAQP